MTEIDRLIRFSSSRFGDLAVPEDRIIKVPEGIIGFRNFNRYALLDPSGGESLFLWLQAVDEPDLAFIITNPLAFVQDYEIDTAEPDLARLGIEKRASPALFVIVTVPHDDPNNANANLIAPLVYFEDDNTLFQIVLEKSEWSLRHPLVPPEESSDEEREVD